MTKVLPLHGRHLNEREELTEIFSWRSGMDDSFDGPTTTLTGPSIYHPSMYLAERTAEHTKRVVCLVDRVHEEVGGVRARLGEQWCLWL